MNAERHGVHERKFVRAHLHGHSDVSRFMEDLLYRPVRASSELVLEL